VLLVHENTRFKRFSWEILTLFGPENPPAPFSGGASDVEPDFGAALRSATQVCTDLKISTSAEDGCGAWPLND
jgi:hypothetical protein